jgi:hypothetical protein
MTLSEVAAIAGKPGLFRILKPTRNGVIIESIDAEKRREVSSSQAKVSILNDITIYTYTAEGTIPLREVLKTAFEKYPQGCLLSAKSDGAELVSFLKELLPEYDEERVYASDIKKLVTWFNLLATYSPEVFAKETEETTDEKVEENPKAETLDSAEKVATDLIETPLVAKVADESLETEANESKPATESIDPETEAKEEKPLPKPRKKTPKA